MDMKSDFDEDNVFDTVFPYRILRNVYHADEGTYPVQMKLKAGMDQSYAEEVVELLDGLGIIEPIPGTDPQLYEARLEGLVDRWREFWEQEVDEVPVTPENFEQFLKRYIESYLETERNSTIREMMVDNFYAGMKTVELSREDEFMNRSYRQLESRLEERYQGSKEMRHHIDEGMGFRQEK